MLDPLENGGKFVKHFHPHHALLQEKDLKHGINKLSAHREKLKSIREMQIMENRIKKLQTEEGKAK